MPHPTPRLCLSRPLEPDSEPTGCSRAGHPCMQAGSRSPRPALSTPPPPCTLPLALQHKQTLLRLLLPAACSLARRWAAPASMAHNAAPAAAATASRVPVPAVPRAAKSCRCLRWGLTGGPRQASGSGGATTRAAEPAPPHTNACWRPAHWLLRSSGSGLLFAGLQASLDWHSQAQRGQRQQQQQQPQEQLACVQLAGWQAREVCGARPTVGQRWQRRQRAAAAWGQPRLQAGFQAHSAHLCGTHSPHAPHPPA